MIAFSCVSCGMKFSVKDEFAGRQTTCPTCRQPLVVPATEQTVAFVAPERIDGQLSSLARAGIDPGVTLGTGGSSAEPHEAGRPSLRQLLAGGGRDGERYLLAGEIARGGMGAVLRAVDCDIRREVAVKYLLDQADPHKKARFVEEAQITGQLEHPNIVPIHELGLDARGRLFFSMKMVKGRSLQQVFAELRDDPRSGEKEYTLGRLLTVFISICHALAYAHSRGVVHRDLKPANIMLGDFGEVYVMDWGLAKVLQRAAAAEQPAGVIQAAPSFAWADEAASASPSGSVQTSRVSADDKTLDGTIMGTPLYMPPEQALGDIAAIDQRSDIYSLGAVLYEMLTLQPPIDKEGGHMAVLLRVGQGEIVPPELRDPTRTRAGKVPRELAAVAAKALAKKREDRYPTVEAMRGDIERFLEGRSVSAKEDSRREMIWKFVKRNKGLSGGVAAALLVLLCSLFFIAKAWLRAERAYAAYQREQEDKKAQARQSAPAFVRAARLAINERQFDDALTQARVAVDYAPDNADAHMLKAELLIVGQDYEPARTELEAIVAMRQNDDQAKLLLQACRKARRDDTATLVTFADLFTRQKSYALADGMLRSLGKNAVEAKEKLLAIYRKRIELAWASLGGRLILDGEGKFTLDLNGCKQVDNLEPLRGLPLLSLTLLNCPMRDLSPLQGMPLTSLNLAGCVQVRDLTPLKGMPLTTLSLAGCGQVRDLSPLKDMPLKSLYLGNCRQVGDLSPLKGMSLITLNLDGCQMHDLSPLKGMPLTSLNLGYCVEVRDLSPLKGMPLASLYLGHCVEVRDLSPLKGMSLTTLDLGNCRQVGDLSPLKGMPLTSLYLSGCVQVRDWSPLKGMPLASLYLGAGVKVGDLSPLKGMSLTTLNLDGCQMHDLSPLKGMPLTSLYLVNCVQVRDLSPLKDMPLKSLYLGNCRQVGDLSPLKGMSLTTLNLDGCQMHDLSPLKGMPLTSLDLQRCGQVRDLSLLKGMPLTTLRLDACGQVDDLSPLKGMPLTSLNLNRCGQVRDLSPLDGMNLSEIVGLPPEVDRGMDVLRRMKALGRINVMPAAEFWKKYDAGEFKQYKP